MCYQQAATVTLAQYCLLRYAIPKPSRWIGASAIGFLIGAIAGGLCGGYLQDALDGVARSPTGIADVTGDRTHTALLAGQTLAGALIDLSLGFHQWLVLRWRYSGAEWWIAANLRRLCLRAI